MTEKIKNVAIFCGAQQAYRPEYAELAMQLITLFIQNNISLVYGGGNVGLMGVIADHMLKLNGKVIGVIPDFLVAKERAQQNLTELHVVTSLHARKELMWQLSDGFILLPGGAGSLDEFFEVFTWKQLELHNKPCGIFNMLNYYDFLIQFLDHAVAEGFLKSHHRKMIIIENTPQMLFKHFIS